MVYECEHCGYTTVKKSHFARHKNRKNRCCITSGQNEHQDTTNCPNVDQICPNVNLCSKCGRVLSSKYKLTSHMAVCKGVDSLTCHICKKRFASSSSKSNHIKKATCLTDSKMRETTSITNNITNTKVSNNTIQINVFSNEDIGVLLKDKHLVEKVKRHGKSGLYTLSKSLFVVKFDDDEQPENEEVIDLEDDISTEDKSTLNDKDFDSTDNILVEKDDDVPMECIEFMNIRCSIINTIVDYFRAFTKVKNDCGVQLITKDKGKKIKKITFKLMSSVEGTIPDELFEKLEGLFLDLSMNDEYNDDDDDDDCQENYDDDITNYESIMKNETSQFDVWTMKDLYNKVAPYYEKESKRYVKKI